MWSQKYGTPMNMFYVAGIGVAVFIEFLLISKKNKSTPDKILTLWMFLISLHLFLFYLYFTGDILDFPFLLGVGQPFPLLEAVFLYLYVASLTKQLPRRKLLLVLHFLPAGIMYGYLMFFFFLPAEQKLEIFRTNTNGAGYETYLVLKLYAYYAAGITYVTWSALLLRKHAKNIRDRFSDLEHVNLRWLQILTIGLGGIWVLVIFTGQDPLIFAGVVIFVFLIGFFGVRQADIFAHTPLIPEPGEEKKKYLKSGLTAGASEELHRTLKRLMTEEALFKKVDLSIDDLADRLGVHPNYLSQTINQKEKKNFYDFVNTYRIEEFKRLVALPENRHLRLLSLAYDCGFNSKSSFNRCFKKVTGQTPSEYFASSTGDHVTPS